MFGKNDQPEDLDLLTLQLKLGWKMKGTGVMGHYPIFGEGNQTMQMEFWSTHFPPDTRWFKKSDLFYPLNWRSATTSERVRFSPSQKGHQQNCQEWIVWVGFVSMTPDESDPKWMQSWESFFYFRSMVDKTNGEWQNFTFQNCLTHENFWVVSNILYFPPYLGKWSILTNIFQLGWNHQLEFIDTFWDLLAERNIGHKWYPNCRPGSRMANSISQQERKILQKRVGLLRTPKLSPKDLYKHQKRIQKVPRMI